MEGFFSTRNVETDRIDHAKRARDRAGNRCPLVNIGCNRPKLRNIAARPAVAVHLDGDGRGGDIVIVTGDARIVPDAPPADRVEAYLAKYRDGIRRICMTPESFARTYAVALRVTPRALRGH